MSSWIRLVETANETFAKKDFSAAIKLYESCKDLSQKSFLDNDSPANNIASHSVSILNLASTYLAIDNIEKATLELENFLSDIEQLLSSKKEVLTREQVASLNQAKSKTQVELLRCMKYRLNAKRCI